MTPLCLASERRAGGVWPKDFFLAHPVSPPACRSLRANVVGDSASVDPYGTCSIVSINRTFRDLRVCHDLTAETSAYTARSARRCNLSTRIGRSSASSTTLKSDDPDTDAEQTGFRPNLDREPYHGIGQLFAAEAAKSLCRRLGIDFIIRSYQAPLHGYAFGAWLQRIHDEGRQHGSLRGSPRRHGHVPRLNSITMVIITIKQLKVSENFQKNRAEDVERMKASQKLARKLRDARDTKKSKTDSCAEGFLMQ